MRFILIRPGCIISDITKMAEMYRSTIRYYLERLEADGKIVFIKRGKFSYIFPCSPYYTDLEKLIISYMNNKTASKILYTIFLCEGITNQELSNQIHMNRGATHRYLKKFVSEKIITKRNKCYYMTDDSKKILHNRLRSSWIKIETK